MARRIVDTSRPVKRIRDISSAPNRIEPEVVAEALGAQELSRVPSGAGNPLSFFALRERLHAELTSTGGRPGRQGVVRRRKVPLTEHEWEQLRLLADSMEELGIRASPGQVAGALLHQSLKALEPLAPERARQRVEDLLSRVPDLAPDSGDEIPV